MGAKINMLAELSRWVGHLCALPVRKVRAPQSKMLSNGKPRKLEEEGNRNKPPKYMLRKGWKREVRAHDPAW